MKKPVLPNVPLKQLVTFRRKKRLGERVPAVGLPAINDCRMLLVYLTACTLPTYLAPPGFGSYNSPAFPSG